MLRLGRLSAIDCLPPPLPPLPPLLLSPTIAQHPRQPFGYTAPLRASPGARQQLKIVTLLGNTGLLHLKLEV